MCKYARATINVYEYLKHFCPGKVYLLIVVHKVAMREMNKLLRVNMSKPSWRDKLP